MKKLLKFALATSCVFALASCGYSEDVLKDTEHTAWVIAGQNEVKNAEGDWIVNAWGGTEHNQMTATSVKAVSEISEDVADQLKGKDLKYLYMGEVRLGVKSAGWTSNAKKPDGTMWKRDGSYAVKSIIVDYNEEDEKYLNTQWISDPKTAYVESLTPDTLFYPTWQEKKDADGFAWDQNPMCIGEAGIYTFIVAKYQNASAVGKPGFGAALVLKEQQSAAVGDVKIETPYADLTKANFGVAGNVNGGDHWNDDVNLTLKDGKFVTELTLAVGNELKVRADDKWDTNFGFGDMEENENFEEGKNDEGKGNGNIKCKVAGTYTLEFTINPTGLVATIKLTKKA